ncbi:CAAX amino terminal protease family protein [Myxococcus stipitatus DSM 14675]|uniref:CAAX amino terminal protease family protein n=1 Tax=Myxococcus stipitatus (strain DSM 14675 / JCM 12634 / Mx s8) TaxID=1278073 RepID=L7UAM2_MYXSD|nr:type II CAAX endopeptidase family protein [Myxococcus stipitatus]AGC45946.1 CAAX amino terminal protease family protein [Myxococcus stipitatus DSM 14675]
MEDSVPTGPSAPPPPEPRSPRGLALGGAALALVLFILVGGSVQFLNAAFGIWFTEIFIFMGLAWLLPRVGGWKPARYTGFTPVPLASTGFGFLLGVANFFALVVPIQFVAQKLAPEWLKEMVDGARLFEQQTPLELAIILTGVTVAAPICEELFFRGIFQKGITPAPPASPTRALVVSAVVFSAFHLDPVGFTARVELGLLFGWLYLRTGSLWPGIGAHAANNLVSSLLFLAAKAVGSEAEDADTSIQAVAGLAGLGWLGLTGLLAFARRRPAVWGPGPVHGDEAARETRPVPSLATLLLPWVTVATLSLVLLVVVDRRGLALKFYDAANPLTPLKKDAAPGLQAERKALDSLRDEARRGAVPLEAYQEERLRQVREHTRADPRPGP